MFLSNNFLSNIGALPLLLKDQKFSDVKIYATTPVAKLGYYIFEDAFISKCEQTEFTKITDAEITASFLNLCEVKFKENIELKHKGNDLVITPITSGFSLGGSCWKINYKLYSIIYAPQFSIESKYICDPFPYELFKNSTNMLITDAKCSKNISVQKYIIEKKLKKNITTCIEKSKNIFIPCDSANICIDLIIRLEKILDEYYFIKNKDDIKTETSEYRVLICGYSSHEIVESVKSLIEFMGSSISQQFYTYNENPFNFKYVVCVKDYSEYLDKKRSGTKFIILSSFESLDTGLSYVKNFLLENIT
jgi:Cft2 family RNA processing exonuclease